MTNGRTLSSLCARICTADRSLACASPGSPFRCVVARVGTYTGCVTPTAAITRDNLLVSTTAYPSLPPADRCESFSLLITCALCCANPKSSHPPPLPVVFLQRGRGMGLHAGRRKAPTGHSRRKQRDGGRHWFPEHFRRDHRRSAHGCCALIFFFLAFVLSVTDSRLARRRLKTILTGHVRQIPAPLFLLKPTLSSPSPHTHFIGLLSDQPRLGHCGAVARVD